MSDDDLFHNVIMSEERLQEEGFNEGRNDGRKTGLQEGYSLGWEKGSGIGSEVGFYSGFAKSLLEEISWDEDASISQRVVKSLQRVETLCANFPLTDPQYPELQEKLEEIRAKFKQVCSMLGIKPEDKQTDKQKGVSF